MRLLTTLFILTSLTLPALAQETSSPFEEAQGGWQVPVDEAQTQSTAENDFVLFEPSEPVKISPPNESHLFDTIFRNVDTSLLGLDEATLPESIYLPPDTLAAQSDIAVGDLDAASFEQLSIMLWKVDNSLNFCKALRSRIDEVFGDQPISNVIDPQWIKVYQNCVVQRRSDLTRIQAAITEVERASLDGADDESASAIWENLALTSAQSAFVSRRITQEYREQTAMVKNWNDRVTE